MHAQAARLDGVAAYGRELAAAFAFAATREPPPSYPLLPAEGWCTRGGFDPLCLQRMRHDVAVLDPDRGLTAMDIVIAEQAVKLSPCLVEDARILDQAEQRETPEGPVRIVNKVCTVYGRPLVEGERALEMDESSECDERAANPRVRDVVAPARRARRNRVLQRARHDYGDEETESEDPVGSGRAGAKDKKGPPLPSILSLRMLQRKWLPLGYAKNKVGTGLSVRYSRPLTSTHIAFTTSRLFCTGANNPHNDRAVMYHATLPYLFRPVSRVDLKPRRFGSVKRISQNIVASLKLPPHRSLCLGLFHSRMTPEAAVTTPARFKSIVVEHTPLRATFLFYRDNIICVGASSLDDLEKAYEYFRPIVTDCYNTPENVAAELELVRRGAVATHVSKELLGYAVNDAGNVEPVYDEQAVARTKKRGKR